MNDITGEPMRMILIMLSVQMFLNGIMYYVKARLIESLLASICLTPH